MSRVPAWKLMLSWLLERGDVGIALPEILRVPYEGRLLGASYRQRIRNIREKLGQDAVLADPRRFQGETHTVYWMPKEIRQEARELLYAGAHPMEYPKPKPAPHLAETARLFKDGSTMKEH